VRGVFLVTCYVTSGPAVITRREVQTDGWEALQPGQQRHHHCWGLLSERFRAAVSTTENRHNNGTAVRVSNPEGRWQHCCCLCWRGSGIFLCLSQSMPPGGFPQAGVSAISLNLLQFLS
jgi:hypothetical protein